MSTEPTFQAQVEWAALKQSFVDAYCPGESIDHPLLTQLARDLRSYGTIALPALVVEVLMAQDCLPEGTYWIKEYINNHQLTPVRESLFIRSDFFRSREVLPKGDDGALPQPATLRVSEPGMTQAQVAQGLLRQKTNEQISEYTRNWEQDAGVDFSITGDEHNPALFLFTDGSVLSIEHWEHEALVPTLKVR